MCELCAILITMGAAESGINTSTYLSRTFPSTVLQLHISFALRVVCHALCCHRSQTRLLNVRASRMVSAASHRRINILADMVRIFSSSISSSPSPSVVSCRFSGAKGRTSERARRGGGARRVREEELTKTVTAVRAHVQVQREGADAAFPRNHRGYRGLTERTHGCSRAC